MSKPILCLDFDGVIHSYDSGWQGADVIPDEPVPGAMAFITNVIETETFELHIFSSRTHQRGGLDAMKAYMQKYLSYDLCQKIEWPQQKPPAMVTLDDRAIQFTGVWPLITELLKFKPWNKQ